MESFWQDLRFGARMLSKKPAFTLIAVITLALGIGANTAIFTVINGVLLRPLPYDEPERLMMLFESNPQRQIDQQFVAPPHLAEWWEQSRSFENIAYWTGHGEFNLVTAEGSEKVTCAYVTSNLFATLRVKPLMGRGILPEEDQLEGPRAAVLSYEAWQRRFAADPNVLGQTLIIDTFGRRDYTIVGVMEPGFHFPQQTEIWLPVGWNGLPRARRGPWLSVIARLHNGVSLEEAQTEMNTIQARIAARQPNDLLSSRVAIIPLLEQTLGRNLRRALLILWGVVACILLIACANVANLLLARAADRQKEIAIRLALGCGRSRLIRQLLTESLLLALGGGVLGTLLAHWSLKLLIAFNADHVPRLNEVRLDGWSLAFTLLVAGLTGLVFGLAPAWQLTKPDMNVALKEGGRGEGLQHSRLRSLLVVAEVAISLVLLVGASLMIRSFALMTQVDRGIKPEQVLTAEVDFSISGFTSWVRATETRPQVTLRELIERLKLRPDVQEAAASGIKASMQITVENRQTGVEEDYPRTSYQGVTADYFRALGIPVLQGRTFTENDTLENPRVIILSESLAKQLFPNDNPIGKRIHPSRLNPGQVPQPDRWTNAPAPPPSTATSGATSGNPGNRRPPEQWTNISLWAEVVGVVADVKSMKLDPQIEPNVYVPYWQWPMQAPTLFVRTNGAPANLGTTIYSEVKALNNNLPAPKVRTMNERLSDVVAEPRFQTLLLGLFGLLTLALVSAGIYAVISYSVAQRTPEIGVRLALGAQRQDVLRLVIGQGMKLALIGIGLGMAGALLLTRIFKTLLFGVSTTDPLAFGLAALLLTGVVLLACYVPARRAANVDPLVALRHE